MKLDQDSCWQPMMTAAVWWMVGVGVVTRDTDNWTMIWISEASVSCWWTRLNIRIIGFLSWTKTGAFNSIENVPIRLYIWIFYFLLCVSIFHQVWKIKHSRLCTNQKKISHQSAKTCQIDSQQIKRHSPILSDMLH